MNIPKPIVQLTYFLARTYWRIFKPIEIGVRAILIKDNKVVLVKPKYKKVWNIPGGGLKRGETPEKAVRREVWEETQVKMNNLDLIGIYTNFTEGKTDNIIVFFCDDFMMKGDEFSWEIEEKRFFKLNNLPNNFNKGAKRRLEEILTEKKKQFHIW
ncbi:MAG: NUDIX domain-containing protein [Candidatus Margulisbacteria bacterium]|nr:NUDIX domain-containing protein [Candidatus Margulisiibacteriota bacterium]